MAETLTFNQIPVAQEVVAPPPLQEKSAANIANIAASYVDEAVAKGQFETPQAALDAVRKREAEVADSHAVTINMSASSLDHFLNVGGLETAWDAARQGGTEQVLGELTLNGKDMEDGYDDVRRTAEDGVRQYAPGDALRHEPVYAALAGPSEERTGAAPSYGSFWLELGNAHAERAVYSFSDSMASVKPAGEGLVFDSGALLDAKDAVTAKAVVDLMQDYRVSKGIQVQAGGMVRNANLADRMTVADRRPAYVEAVLFDPISAEDVTIGMAINNEDDMSGAGKLFATHAEALSGAKVYCGDELPPVVTEWLGAHTAPTAEAATTPRAQSALWEQLGLTPDASHEDVSQALTQRAVLAYRDLVRSGTALPRMASYSDSVQWNGYVKSLQAASRNVFGSSKQLLDEFIALQEAQVFFARRVG